MNVTRIVPVSGLASARIVRAARAAAGDMPINSLSIALVDDKTIAVLNERYLGKSHPTDVLAFDLRDQPGAAGLEGEIVISVETARRQASELGLTASEELLRYVVHGVLHLAGYDDARPAGKRRMRLAEDEILARIGAGDLARSRRRACRSKMRTTSRV